MFLVWMLWLEIFRNINLKKKNLEWEEVVESGEGDLVLNTIWGACEKAILLDRRL